jgi:hypothetical protein
MVDGTVYTEYSKVLYTSIVSETNNGNNKADVQRPTAGQNIGQKRTESEYTEETHIGLLSNVNLDITIFSNAHNALI